MSGAALGWAKAQKAPSMTAKAVLVCLADYADSAGVAWPSIPKLAAEVQASERTIQRCIRALEDAGLLTRCERQRKDGGDTSNAYTLAMAPGDTVTPPRCQDVTPPVSLMSPANGTPSEPSTPDGDMTIARQSDFDRFWAAYPHKVGKKAALMAWKRAKDRPAVPVLLAALDLYRQTKPADRAWCNPATWLNQGRWEDGVAEAAAAAPAEPSFNAPQVRASIVRAADEEFARRFVDPYCRWLPESRRLEAKAPQIVTMLASRLAEWAKRYDVTIAVAAANDPTATPATGAAA